MLEEKHNKEQPQSPTKPQESQAAEAAQHPTADNPAPPEENVVPTSQKTESTQPKTQAVSEASTDEQVTIQEREQAQIEESILQPSEDELRRLAFTDELTGLNNRRFMRTRVPSYINFAKQNSSFLCLVMLDLDSFKQINDQHGHMAGDKVLTFFGETLTEHVGRRGIPIRYAGDEFSVVMMEAEKSDAKQMMDSFIEKLQQTPVAVGDDAEVNVGVSIGIAHYPQDASDYDELFKRADEALYHAKGSGKNMVVVYPDEGKLIAPGNISTLFPVEKTVGFDDIIEKLKLLTIDRIVGENAKPEFPILCGPMGSGKTRLLNELRREAEKQGHGVIYVCGKVDQNRPYNALIAAFNDALIKDLPFFKELAGELSYNEKTELTKNIPQLAEIPDPPDDGSSEDRDTVVFKALNKLLFGLLRKARQLLIVDDAHLVDVASLSFIDSFVTEFPNSELDLAFSITTDEDYTSDSAMAHILGGMSKTAQIAEITRLEIPKLSQKDITGILYQITGRIDIPDEILEGLAKQTEGNPFFVEELLKLAVERGLIIYDGTSWSARAFDVESLPNSLDDILSERAARLSEEDTELLKVASVIGESFDVRELAELSETDEQEVLDALERARRSHIIREDPHGESDFMFTSKSSREAFYSLWDKEKLKNEHLEVAELEKELYSDAPEEVLDRLAYHFQQAERWDMAAMILSAASERSVQARIPEATRRMLQRRAYIDDMARESTLEKEDVGKAVKTFRNVKVAIQAFRLYPRENENVAKSLDRALENLNYFFTKTEVLTFSVTHEDILVNGQEPGPEFAEPHLAEEFRELISPYGLQGIIFFKGLEKEELADFFEIFKRKPEEVADNWDEIIKEKELKHVRPDRKVYVAVGERKVFLGTDSIMVDTAKKSGGGGEDSEIAKQALDRVEELLKEFRKDSQNLLLAIESGDSSVLNVDVEKLVTVIKEVGGYLPEHEEHSDVPPPEVMQMSEQVDKEMVTQMATSMATRLASQMINQLAAGQLPPQMDPELASQLAENLSAAKEAAAQQGIIGQPAIMPQPPEEPMLAPIQTESTLTPPDIPTTQPSVKAPPVEQWINDLKNDNRLVKARAAQNLVAAGADAIESCINAILNEESVYHRRLLATIVKRIGPQGINAFNQTFQRDWNPPTFASLASVADIFAGNQPIMEKLSSLILHPDKIVRSATLSALANAPEDVKTRAIATGISSENIEIKNDAIKAVGELDLRSLTPQLLEIINKKTIIKMLPDTSVATAAIKALSDFKDNSTVGNIVEIAKPEGFFHFGKSLPESIHIEAINALADIGTPEAVEALKKISKSGKKAIKNAAAAALARVSAT